MAGKKKPKKRRRKAGGSGCPCGSGRPYAACCGRFHGGEEPPDAEALMRSRFAAFARGEYEYLWRTLHPEHADRSEPKAEWIAGAKETTAPLSYRRLRVLGTDGPDEEGIARVLFHAVVGRRGRDVSFAELSRFAHDGEGWRYLDGIPLPNRALPKPIDALDIAAFVALVARLEASTAG